MNKELLGDLKKVFKDTNQPQIGGFCNITFLTFLMANYSDEYIKENLKSLYSIYKGNNNEC